MQVKRGFSNVHTAPTALTIGNFDGMHLGHRALLARVVAAAKHDGLRPAVLTFEPHPREYFAPESAPARLSTLREKLEQLSDAGIDLATVGRFDVRLAAHSAEAFIDEILLGALNVKHLVIGDDFHFGAHRRGNLAMLRAAGERKGFTVEAMPSVLVEGERVSSSAVRNALAAGRLEHAARLLGRPYSIDGQVVHGQKLGRHLGFATANIRIKHDKPPLTGVFAVVVHGLDGAPHIGVANLGVRPSANTTPRPILEVHLFDFSAEIYGEHLNVRFLHKLRDETRFPDLAALTAQITRDVAQAQDYFSRINTEQSHG